MKAFTFELLCFLIAFFYKTYFFIFIRPIYIGKINWKLLKENKRASILLLWHNDEIMQPFLNRNSDITIMISLSKDGELLANTLKHLGYKSIRGSSSKRALAALQDMINASKNGHDTCFATDGPRGPRHTVKSGAIVSASKTGNPLILTACSASKKFIFKKSWDRGVLPLPFSKVVIFYSEPIYIPPNLEKEDIEDYRLYVENIYKRLTENALNFFNINFLGFNVFERFFLFYPCLRKIVFLPFSLIYTLIIQTRNLLFEKSFLKSITSPSKIISIGNLTLGGTGKTPYTIHLAKELMNEGNKENELVIITKNYTDESKMITHKGFNVISSKVKYMGIIEAHKKHSPKTIIVDDGFQHRYFKRDEDIVLINATEDFLTNKVFPSGTLREPLENLKRATKIIITRADEIQYKKASIKYKKFGIYELKTNIKKYNSNAKICESVFESHCDVDLTDKKLLLVSATSNPQSFATHARRLGAIVKKQVVFPDHYIYNENDYIFLNMLKKGFDYILTTEKDAVKLNPSKIDFKVLKIDFKLIASD